MKKEVRGGVLGMVIGRMYGPEFVPNGSDLHLRLRSEGLAFACIYPRFTLGLRSHIRLKMA